MGLFRRAEDRSLSRDNVPAVMLPGTRTAVLDVNSSNVLRVSDAFACVSLLSNAVSSLPPKVYRKTETGRVPAGDDQRLVQLLRRPSPGSTSADLFGQILNHLAVYGNAFIGKFRGGDNEIVQLALLHPDRVQVELRGQTIVYRVDGKDEYGLGDILHIKSMSADGLRGMSPVTQCRLALGLSSSLQESAKRYFEQGSKPSGVLSLAPGGQNSQIERAAEDHKNKHAGVERMHQVLVVEGEASFTPIAFSADDNQFLQQRELSAREVARIFGIPGYMIGAAAAGDLTYANASQVNRHFLDYSLMPWITRLERAFSNDTDLCPGNTYLKFGLDAFLRPDPDTRSQIYTRALDPISGWMNRAEVRDLEELDPETETAS